jgi:hypothetical protein
MILLQKQKFLLELNICLENNDPTYWFSKFTKTHGFVSYHAREKKFKQLATNDVID